MNKLLVLPDGEVVSEVEALDIELPLFGNEKEYKVISPRDYEKKIKRIAKRLVLPRSQ